jgi:hypothetical protein
VLEPVVIILIVDVEQDSRIFDFHFKYRVQVIGKDCPAAGVPFQCHDLGKNRPTEQYGVAAFALVGGNDNLRPGPMVSRHDLVEGLGPNEGLVPEDDEGGAGLRSELAIPWR